MIKGFQEVMPVAMVICDVKNNHYSIDIITYIIHVHIHWHPSVLKDYGVALWLVILEQRRVWLVCPIREWQSFPYSEQMWSIAGLSPWFRAFLVRVSLCLSLSGKCLFKLGKVLLNCRPPRSTFWSQSFPSVVVNAQGLQVPLADLFKA